MAIFPKSDPSTKLEAQLKTKVGARADNSERLKAAEARLAEARANVERLATESDEGALDRALQVRRSAEDKCGALSAAIAKLGSEIVDIEKAIEAMRDKAVREETAEAIRVIAKRLDASATTFDGAIADLESVLRECSPIVLDAHGCVAFAMSSRQQLPPAIAVVIEGLRQYRAGVLGGTVAASLPVEAPAPPKLEIVPPPPHLTIFALQNLKFIAANGDVVCIGRNKRHDVPAKLADLALAEHVALPLSDKRCRDLEFGAVPYVPDAASCAWLGPKGKELPPKTARPGPPIASSHFEPHPNVGEPFSVKVPRQEPVAMGARAMPEDEQS